MTVQDFVSGAQLALMIFGPIAKRTKNKADDAFCAGLGVIADNPAFLQEFVDKINDALKTPKMPPAQ